MKKVLFFVLILGLLIQLSSCSVSSQDPAILSGYTACNEFWDVSGFQDYTDYCEYYYTADDDDRFAQNELYSKVENQDIPRIANYFTNFKSWMEVQGRIDEYGFNESLISSGDFIYIKTKEGQKNGNTSYREFDNYTIYFYDIDSHTLFYIHNNI